MRFGGDRRVLEIIRVAIPLAAKIEPGLRVLMHEQRRVGPDVAQPVVFKRGALPRIPCVRRQGMRRRSQAQQVNHHQLAVVIPAIGQESKLGRPAVRQKNGVFREPAPIHAGENLRCQPGDLRITKMLPGGKHAAQQNSRVHRRNFRVPDPLAAGDVGPVEKESAVRGHLPRQEVKRDDHSIACFFVGHPAALLADTQRRQAEAGSRDAGHDAAVGAVGFRPVFHQSGVGMALLPEIKETCLFNFIQETVVSRRKRGARAGDRSARHAAERGTSGGHSLKNLPAGKSAAGHHFQYPEIGGWEQERVSWGSGSR